MTTGFLEFNPSVHSAEQNLLTYRNIISPFADTTQISPAAGGGTAYVDENYGHVYDDYYLKGNTTIYGKADSLPEFSGDRLANFGFLRVPFRRIPRIMINNRTELLDLLSTIESKDSNLRIVYRGQYQEYYVDRDKATLATVYGDENSLEPSLITSAARKNLRLQDVLPSWMGLLNLYIERVLGSFTGEERNRLRRSITNFQASSDFNLFSLAMAQHYGLPSVGLDVTPDIEVALFFALRKFTATSTPFHYQYEDRMPDKPPVIYIIAPTEAQQLNYFDFKPPVLPFVRPDAQSARFIHTGWGLNKNFAATRIFLALYLNPDGDFGPVKSTEELFPGIDPFAELIDRVRANHLYKDDVLSKFFESFYLIRH